MQPSSVVLAADGLPVTTTDHVLYSFAAFGQFHGRASVVPSLLRLSTIFA